MLHFSPTPTSLWIGITALILVAALSSLTIARSSQRRRTTLLEGMRMLAIAMVVALLWQPEWQKIIQPESKPQIVILHDASKSMETIDASNTSDMGPKVLSRAEAATKILASDDWRTLESNGKNEVTRISFAKAAPDTIAGTDINAALTDALKRHDNLRAVIMLSDGDHNIGTSPITAAQKMRMRDIPHFAIPVGSTKRLPDIEILTVAAPGYGIVGENVQIPFTIRSSLDRQVRTVVRMRDESGLEQSKNITIAPNSETYESMLWRIRQEGSSTLQISLPVHEGELIAANNTHKFSIAGRPEKIRVLIVESLPRWEYRFLRNALSRDPGVELSCLLFHPTLGPGGGPHYISAFPSKPEDLAPYDVIFLGDVGIGNNQLTKEQCTLIRGLVENQASGVVFLPGSKGNQFSLLDTDLADLMPVVLDDKQRKGIRDPLAAPLTLTSEGRSSLLTLLGENEEENPEIWRQLPGFHWHALVIKAKAGAEVLAVHGNSRGKFGATPLLVTKSAGNGKVLFMGIDSAWRWRRGVEDLYHYRFWGQVARWMSYQRNMAAGKRVRVFFNPERPQLSDTVTLNANAFEPDGSPCAMARCRSISLHPTDAANASASKNWNPPGALSADASKSTNPATGNSASPITTTNPTRSKQASSPKDRKSKKPDNPHARKSSKKSPASPEAASSSPIRSPHSSMKSTPSPNHAPLLQAPLSGPTGSPSPPSSHSSPPSGPPANSAANSK